MRKVSKLNFDWLKNLAKCYDQPRRGIRQIRDSPEKMKSGECLPVERYRIGKTLANPDFLANAYSGELLRALLCLTDKN